MTTPLRVDFDTPELRALARHSKDAGQARHLLALAVIYEGDGVRVGTAAMGSVDRVVGITRHQRQFN